MYQTENWSEIEVALVRQKSKLVTCKNIQPLKVLNPRSYNGSCHIVLSNYGGGMVSGDKINIKIKCGKSTDTFINSQSNTRIYKKVDGDITEQYIEGELDEYALAVIFPDPVVLQEDSSFQQVQHWELKRGASLFLVDWFNSGRMDSGEKYKFDTFLSEIKVSISNKLVLLDRFQFKPKEHIADSPVNFGEYQSMLSAYLVGDPDDLKFKQMVETLNVLKLESQPSMDYDIAFGNLVISITKAREGVYILRAAAKTRMGMQPLCDKIMDMLSAKELLGYNPVKRKF